jgi:molecular chaperone GrpE
MTDTPIQDTIIDESEISETQPTWEENIPVAEETQNDEEVIKRLQESLARSQADYQNLLMRVERDRSEMVSFLSGKILAPILSQVDNLERAVKLKEGVEWDTFVEWVRSMLTNMEKYLESQGVKPFVSLGEEVDPEKHDVMTQAPGPEGKIITEFEKGYLIGNRVLRHAKVVVGSGE